MEGHRRTGYEAGACIRLNTVRALILSLLGPCPRVPPFGSRPAFSAGKGSRGGGTALTILLVPSMTLTPSLGAGAGSEAGMTSVILPPAMDTWNLEYLGHTTPQNGTICSEKKNAGNELC